jgi:hypothetical protein
MRVETWNLAVAVEKERAGKITFRDYSWPVWNSWGHQTTSLNATIANLQI